MHQAALLTELIVIRIFITGGWSMLLSMEKTVHKIAYSGSAEPTEDLSQLSPI